MKTLLLLLLTAVAATPLSAQPVQVSSPDGRVVVTFELAREGMPTYTVALGGRVLVEPSPLGLVTTLAYFDRDLRLTDAGEIERVEDHYRLVHGKRSDVTYVANRRVVRLAEPGGYELEVVFQVSDDGVAFRYRIPAQAGAGVVTAERELTGFRFAPETRTWLMPMDHPRTGWMNTNPSYEAHYTLGEPVGAESPTEVGWAFPGLFHREGVGWALVTEAGLDETYVASRLTAEAERGLYRIAFPDRGEGTGPNDPVDPSFALPFASPWRLIVVGETPGPIVESTLVTDVSPPSTVEDTSWIEPGKATWSWLPLKDESIVPDVQRRFIDMAAAYGFEYTLVDNFWDEKIGYEGLKALADYAAGKGVKLIAWYNSNGNFNDAPQTPRDRMHTPEARRAEFARLREMGVKGVKVDFMGGDKQSVIRLYLDILRDAAEYGILVNFHGATLPRGWQRTYPHYMTVEAVMGYEYITFDQRNADAAPSHGTVLPFTRNVVGPMDFTPTMLTDTVGASVRRTTNGYDLAMPVVFESGIQHLGVTPEVMAQVPDYVATYLGEVPAAWDETRFVAGHPGTYVVLARRKGTRWYVAGLNGEATARTVKLDLPFLDGAWKGTLLTDGDDARGFSRRVISGGGSDNAEVQMLPHGGFVLMIDR